MFSSHFNCFYLILSFALLNFSYSCELNELEIDSDCLIQNITLKKLLADPIPFGLNSYLLTSKTNNANHKLLLIISPEKCDFDDANRCRSYESKSSQTLYIEPYIVENTYFFDFYITVSMIYYSLVQLMSDSMICNGAIRTASDFTINILEDNTFKGTLPFNCSAFLNIIPDKFLCSVKKNNEIEDCNTLPTDLKILLTFGGKMNIAEINTKLSTKVWTPLFFSLRGDDATIVSQNIQNIFVLDSKKKSIGNLFSIKKVLIFQQFTIAFNSIASYIIQSDFLAWEEKKYLKIKIGVNDNFPLLRTNMIFSSVFHYIKEISKYNPIGLVYGSKMYELGKKDFQFDENGVSLNNYWVTLPSYSTKLAIYFPRGYGQIFITKIENTLSDTIPVFVQTNFHLEIFSGFNYFIFTYLIFNYNGNIQFLIAASPEIIIVFEMTKNFNETIFAFQDKLINNLEFSTNFQGDKEEFLTVMIRLNGTGRFNLQYKNIEMENFEDIQPNNIIFANSVETETFTSVCTTGYTNFETWSCLSSCSSLYFSPLDVCKTDCTDLVTKDSTCECPINRPFYYFTSLFELVCISKCPDDYPFFKVNLECVKSCPHFTFYPSKICVDKCDGMQVQNKQCACFLNQPFHYLSASGDVICGNKCPSSKEFFNLNFFCDYSCPVLWIDQIKLCVDSCDTNFQKNEGKCKCPKNKPFYDLNEKLEVQCLETCSNFYNPNYECVDICGTDFPKIYNKTACVQNCSYLNMYNVQGELNCIDKCPSNKSYYFESERICYEKCPDSKSNCINANGTTDDENFIIPIIIVCVLVPAIIFIIIIFKVYKKRKGKYDAHFEEPNEDRKTIYKIDLQVLISNQKLYSVFKPTKAINIDQIQSSVLEEEFQLKKTQEIIIMDSENHIPDPNPDPDPVLEYPKKSEEQLIEEWKSKKIFYEIKKCENPKNLEYPFELRKLKPIGKGGEGQIYMVEDKINEKFAYKCFAEKTKGIDTQSKEYKKLESELAFFDELRNPTVLYADGVIYEKENDLISYGIKVDLMDHDLRKFLKTNQAVNYSIRIKISICTEIINSIISIHKKDVAHNDLKPENILLKRIASSDEYIVRISDFGCAQKVDNNNFSEIKGITYLYASPEYALSSLDSSAYQPNLKNDIWSFGLILHEMFLGDFDDKIPHLKILKQMKGREDINKLKNSIYGGGNSSFLSFEESPKNSSNEPIIDLIIACLQIDSEKRPNSFEIREKIKHFNF